MGMYHSLGATGAECVRVGIRCAVQLEVLRLLEVELKGRLPLQYFFDLIVGTK
jgi:hypothetical protein